LSAHYSGKLRFGHYSLQNRLLNMLNLREAQPNLAKNLDSQTLAAFGAACVDHGTTTRRFHACQKAVGAGATNFRGLVCAFHDSS
jgi:hypothetical protein